MPYPISRVPSLGGQNSPIEPTARPLSPSAGKSSAQSTGLVVSRTAATSDKHQGRRTRPDGTDCLLARAKGFRSP